MKQAVLKNINSDLTIEDMFDQINGNGSNGNGNGNANSIKKRTRHIKQSVIQTDLFTINIDALSKEIEKRLSKNAVDYTTVREIVKEELSGLKKEIVVKAPDMTEINIGMQHYQFEPLLRLISMRKNVLLVGPTSSGKTHTAHQIAKALNLNFYADSFGKQSSKVEIHGYKSATGEYVPVKFREAYERGGLYCADELDAASANILVGINAALSNGQGAFPDRMVKRHKDFCIIACANTYGRGADRRYVGRNQLDASTLNRFWVMEFDYDEKLEESLAFNKQWCRKVHKIRKIVDDQKENVIVSTRAIIDGQDALANGFSEQEVMDALIFQGINHEVKSRILKQLNRGK